MFVDDKKNNLLKTNTDNYADAYIKKEHRLSPNNILFIVIGVFLFAVFAVVIAVFIFDKPLFKKTVEKKNEKKIVDNKRNQDVKTGLLPGNNENQGEDFRGDEFSDFDLMAEKLHFGFFYNANKDDFQRSAPSYKLPINIKTDVLNYYQVARKVNLDPFIENINKNGFSYLGKNFSNNRSDFFSMNRAVAEKSLPLFISSDFIFYFYQNNLKQVFKDVEANVFYENLWNINKALFDKALARYRARLSQVGEVNDPILEAERLECAYFAVVLSILTPKKEQINLKSDFIDNTKFNKNEGDFFSFTIPNFLKVDVGKELDFIFAGNTLQKSPVLLYPVDYKIFKVPREYSRSAKLNNFYLATKWLSLAFPLYYKSQDCEDCLLDYDDWKINFLASSLLAKDLYEDQSLKNQWASIYKILSFFRGLRADLTYLHYNQAFTQLFGDNYNIEQYFSDDLSGGEKKENLLKAQQVISGFDFLDIQGKFNRSSKEDLKKIGMRMLQEPFWPNDYLLNYLSGKDLTVKKDFFTNKEYLSKNITVCQVKNKLNSYRCRGFSLDIVNLFYPIKKDYPYFRANIAYNNYDERNNFLKKEIALFDKFNWNSNVYWMTLDISKLILSSDVNNYPVFMRGDVWNYEKNLNTVLGAWVNLHLADDEWSIYERKKTVDSTGFGFNGSCNFDNYVEPNFVFVEDLIARNNMLIKMLDALKITTKTNTSIIKLKDLNAKFEQLASIIKKELSGKKISDADCEFIDEFAKRYEVSRAKKDFVIKFDNAILKESIDGVRPLAVVYEKNGDKIMAIGPVFNYQER